MYLPLKFFATFYINLVGWGWYTKYIELLYICTLPSHQYILECCKLFWTKICPSKWRVLNIMGVKWCFYVKIWYSFITVGQRNYFTTSVTVLYQLPNVAVLCIIGNNNVIFRTLPQYQFRTLRPMVKFRTC